MRRRAWILLLGSLALPVTAQGKLAKVTTLPLAKGFEGRQVWVGDVDGNGEVDLVVATNRADRDYQRQLQIYLRRKGVLRSQPDRVLTVPRSVSACAIGDVHPNTGDEILWFGARGVYMARLAAPERERTVKLVAGEFLYQLADRASLYSWQTGVQDVNGDGRLDLLLPKPRGYRVAIQKPTAAKFDYAVSQLRLPPAKPRPQAERDGRRDQQRRQSRFAFRFRDRAPQPPLVDIRETTPAPQWADWDGDGDLDLVARDAKRLMVWKQQPGGRFAEQPDLTFPFPLTQDQAAFDPSFSSFLGELNGDKRADSVLLAKDRNSDSIRTQVLVFLQRPKPAADPLFQKGVPQQLLILSGFANDPRLVDIDGNGSLDLSVIAWRVDVLDQVTSGEDRSLDVELYAFLNRRGRFNRRPDITFKTTLQADVLQRGGSKLFARFIGDVTGDGVRELLVRDRPERIRLHLVRGRRGQFSVFERPIWEIKVDDKAKVRFVAGNKRPSLLVIEEGQLLWIEF